MNDPTVTRRYFFFINIAKPSVGEFNLILAVVESHTNPRMGLVLFVKKINTLNVQYFSNWNKSSRHKYLGVIKPWRINALIIRPGKHYFNIPYIYVIA